MGQFDKYVRNVLGVKVPIEYATFMDKYGGRLAANPIAEKSWVSGLGNRDFVVGTTQAFRNNLSGFATENIVIGYLGIKTIVIHKTYEEIDNYVMLNTRDGTILSIDSLGAKEPIANNFEEWVGSELLRANLKERYDSTLTVILFDNEFKAEEIRERLIALKRQNYIDLEDMVVVIKKQDGAVQLDQAHKLARKGGLAGTITGLIVGGIFFTPLLGGVLGGIAGALSASLADIGIDDRFMKDLSQKFQPGCSALFTLIRKADPERVKEALFGFGGKVLVNSWSKEREVAIQSILDASDEGAQ